MANSAGRLKCNHKHVLGFFGVTQGFSLCLISHKNVFVLLFGRGFFLKPTTGDLTATWTTWVAAKDCTLCWDVIVEKTSGHCWTYFNSGEVFRSNGCASVGLNVLFQQAKPQVHLLLTGTVDDDGIQADTCRGAKVTRLIMTYLKSGCLSFTESGSPVRFSVRTVNH